MPVSAMPEVRIMIDLYYWTTPNGHKITMFLEETGLPYRIVPVNINTGAQFDPAFLAGQFSIADIAAYPWVVPHEAQRQNLEDFPYLKRWFQALHDRPATVRAYEKAASVNPSANAGTPLTEEARRVLFGQTAR